MKASISLAAALSGMAGAALAQSVPTLPDTVVTATRIATRADELVTDTVVIDRARIDRMANRTLSEILARAAGVQITANGGPGQASSVSIRGTEARHTILLIDGVRYGSATLGTPIWDNIPVEMIERIEVIKGPASALYGSDGVGGVVQVFMRKGEAGDPAFTPRASTTLGSDSYRQITGGFSGASGAATYSLGVQRTTVNSFSATNSKEQFGNFNPDRDPFSQSAVSGSFGYRFDSGWKLDAGLLHAEGLVHFDDGPDRDSRAAVRTQTTYLGTSGPVMPGWNTQLRYGRSDDYSRNIVAAPYDMPGLFNTTQNQYLWQNDVATPVGMAIAGLERLEQNVNSDTPYTVTRRDIDSAFAGLNGDAGPHSWQLNLRHDRNSQFGGNAAWFAGYGYRITPNWRVSVSHGTSFTAPSFNQLYYPDYGNPDLKPEQGSNTDVGIAWNQGGQTVKLVGYDNRIRGFITDQTIAQNIPHARIQGGTLSYDGQFGDLGLHASYEALNPRNEVTGMLLPRRAKAQITFGADYRIGAWKLGGSALHAGRRYDDEANTLVLDPYTTVDLYAEYRVAKDWSVQGRIVNVGNVQYETAYGYNQTGRAFYVTLRWQPR
jgi:vitamin B12 transporter